MVQGVAFRQPVMNSDIASRDHWRREALSARAELARANLLISDAASLLRLPPDAAPWAVAEITRQLEEWKESHAERGN